MRKRSSPPGSSEPLITRPSRRLFVLGVAAGTLASVGGVGCIGAPPVLPMSSTPPGSASPCRARFCRYYRADLDKPGTGVCGGGPCG
jgi:hypothetical protein